MAKKTVMVIDDDQLTLDVVKEVLKPNGYNVVTALDADEGLGKMKKKLPDLVLIDFFLPKVSGKELAEKIRADPKLKKLKLVFFSAARMSATGTKTLTKLKVLDYIQKPFEYQDLLKRVKKIIG